MLVEFSVKNYKSIKDKITLNMVASSDKSKSENTFKDSSGKMTLLKSAAIYGANASGKSNLVNAMFSMKDIILNSHKSQRGEKIKNVVPFRLSSETENAPSEFEIIFIVNNLRYRYGFSLTSSYIEHEWLYQEDLSLQRVVPRMMFERKRIEGGEYFYDTGEYWKPINKEFGFSTLENQLYLSKVVQNNHIPALKVFDWFQTNFKDITSENRLDTFSDFTAELCKKSPDMCNKILEMAKDADFGIEKLQINEETFFESPRFSNVPDDVKKDFLKDVEKRKINLSELISFKFKTYHRTDTNKLVEFDFNDESNGTQMFIALIGPILLVSMYGGCIIVCDELENSLHTLLSISLIKMINEYSEKPFQMIFTTHDSNLLDADIFRRDQIWFTEKNESMATELYSLWDFKPRKDENVRKGYLAGKYGAIPFLGGFKF